MLVINRYRCWLAIVFSEAFESVELKKIDVLNNIIRWVEPFFGHESSCKSGIKAVVHTNDYSTRGAVFWKYGKFYSLFALNDLQPLGSANRISMNTLTIRVFLCPRNMTIIDEELQKYRNWPMKAIFVILKSLIFEVKCRFFMPNYWVYGCRINFAL